MASLRTAAPNITHPSLGLSRRSRSRKACMVVASSGNTGPKADAKRPGIALAAKLAAGAAPLFASAAALAKDFVDPSTGEVFKPYTEPVVWKFLPDAGTDPSLIAADVVTGIIVVIGVGYILGAGSLIIDDPDKKE